MSLNVLCRNFLLTAHSMPPMLLRMHGSNRYPVEHTNKQTNKQTKDRLKAIGYNVLWPGHEVSQSHGIRYV